MRLTKGEGESPPFSFTQKCIILLMEINVENFLVKIMKFLKILLNAFVDDCVKDLPDKVGNDKVVLRSFWRCRFYCCGGFIAGLIGANLWLTSS
jgi:hypothetical protein